MLEIRIGMLKLNYTKTYKSILIRFFTYLFRKSDLRRLKLNYKLFVKLVENSLEKHKLATEDKFLDAWLLLSNKLLIDIESAKILTGLGLYGSAHVMLAVILRTVRMIGALYLKPEIIDEYLDEGKTSDTNKGFRIKFSESSLQKILDERFGGNERGEYANLDKALHGSSVGAKIYYARIRYNSNGTKGGDIIYNAFFEDEKSGAVINILNGALLDACGVYLEKYGEDKDLVEIKSRYYKNLDLEVKNIVKSNLKQTMREMFHKNRQAQNK